MRVLFAQCLSCDQPSPPRAGQNGMDKTWRRAEGPAFFGFYVPIFLNLCQKEKEKV